jgi:hypothetical protein
MLQIESPTLEDRRKLAFLLQSILRSHGVDEGIEKLRLIAIGKTKTKNKKLITASAHMALFVLLFGHKALNELCNELVYGEDQEQLDHDVEDELVANTEESS